MEPADDAGDAVAPRGGATPPRHRRSSVGSRLTRAVVGCEPFDYAGHVFDVKARKNGVIPSVVTVLGCVTSTIPPFHWRGGKYSMQVEVEDGTTVFNCMLSDGHIAEQCRMSARQLAAMERDEPQAFNLKIKEIQDMFEEAGGQTCLMEIGDWDEPIPTIYRMKRRQDVRSYGGDMRQRRADVEAALPRGAAARELRGMLDRRAAFAAQWLGCA